MKVKLIAYTPEPEKLICVAARVCYSNKEDIDAINDDFSENEIRKLLTRLLESRHHSPLEHASFTFSIEDVDRTVTHELVRHRIASFSQRSQRYCSEDGFGYETPESVEASPNYKMFFDDTIRNSKDAYDLLISFGIKKEDARYVLPNATMSRLVMTMNARSLLNFFALRCCNRAQPKMRELAYSILDEVKKVAPILFENAGPSCVQLGYCPENNQSCGRALTLKQLLDNNKKYMELIKKNDRFHHEEFEEEDLDFDPYHDIRNLPNEE